VRSLIIGLAVLAAAGCATRPPLVDGGAAQEKQPAASSAGSGALREIALPRGIHFGYKIYGDPGAAPSQAFDDGRFLFLQFKQGVPPPIPVTRDGKLLEYEVMAGGLVRTSKVDSVVLRLGPRVAYVDRDGVEIVALPALSAAQPAASLVLERPPSASRQAQDPPVTNAPKTPSAPDPKEEVRRLSLRGSSAKEILASVKDVSLDPGLWRLCHSPSVRDLKLARQAKEAVESSFSGVRLMLSDSCGAPGELRLEKL